MAPANGSQAAVKMAQAPGWASLSELDRYVLEYMSNRFDQEYTTRDGQNFRAVFDGSRVRLERELSRALREKLDTQTAMVADLDGPNVMYYETLEELAAEWPVFDLRAL